MTTFTKITYVALFLAVTAFCFAYWYVEPPRSYLAGGDITQYAGPGDVTNVYRNGAHLGTERALGEFVSDKEQFSGASSCGANGQLFFTPDAPQAR